MDESKVLGKQSGPCKDFDFSLLRLDLAVLPRLTLKPQAKQPSCFSVPGTGTSHVHCVTLFLVSTNSEFRVIVLLFRFCFMERKVFFLVGAIGGHNFCSTLLPF